jgi:hypothetical protein
MFDRIDFWTVGRLKDQADIGSYYFSLPFSPISKRGRNELERRFQKRNASAWNVALEY